jgi:L-fuculose-phosphate aldolase
MSDGEWSVSVSVPDLTYTWQPGRDPVSREDVHGFFHNDDRIQVLKQRICEIGHRLWQKDYVDGNGGNISVRVGDSLVLCTPTLISKGFMTPDDLCLVDMQGRQKAGKRPSTSEIRVHLAMMKAVPAAKSCVHAHPPHANAFLISNVVPPTGIMPEPDIFLGEVGFAPYATPGTDEVAATVAALAPTHQCIFMGNHGVVVWGSHVEDAYWKMENIDADCHILLLATQLNAPIARISSDQLRELLAIRRKLRMPEDRQERSDAELFAGASFAGRTIVGA